VKVVAAVTEVPVAGSPVASYLRSLRERHSEVDTGEVATYIPELAAVDPDLFGICLAMVDGAVYEAGDTRKAFTIQSISKPLSYGLALELCGPEVVHARVGVEPSGDPFNEISLHSETGKPLNPMINAGAITCAGLILECASDPFSLLLETYSAYAGRELMLDEDVYRSEASTGHRNRAIAHLLRSFSVIGGDAEAALDLYFRQCSIAVDCRDLATIAATLANGGVNPATGRRAVSEEVVRSVLSVMTTCGMYDGAGEWLVSIGIPAKSGVSGGVLGVLPGRVGVAVFSPRLDERGNSVRGVTVCRDLSNDLALHLVRPGEQAAAPIRASYVVGERLSKRQRTKEALEAIRTGSSRTAVFELQGELGFVAAEAVSRSLSARPGTVELVVLDLRRVIRVDRAGLQLVPALAATLREAGGRLALAGSRLDLGGAHGILELDSIDLALEWCEDELLARLAHEDGDAALALERHPLLDGLSAEELDALLPRLGTVEAEPGEALARSGDTAADIFLVTAGRLSVLGESRHRLATLSPGMAFGEVAYVQHERRRTASVFADSRVTCRTLSYALLDDLATSSPRVYGKLMRNLLAVVAASLQRASGELAHATG
jgi:glutaminase